MTTLRQAVLDLEKGITPTERDGALRMLILRIKKGEFGEGDVPQTPQQPFAWFCFVESPPGEDEPLRIRAWTTDEARAKSLGDIIGRTFAPLYALPHTRPDRQSQEG